jgi:hypothetical protein
VLLEQQSTLRLMQSDSSDANAPHHGREVQSAGFRKPTDLSPWSVAPAVADRRPPLPAAGKSGKKVKKAVVGKQQPLDIPPALTALLKTVKQVQTPPPPPALCCVAPTA